jgi:mono/diheme cytochrome c family protein
MASLLLLLSGCRQYMSEQPRYDPFDPSDFFPDRLSARPLPPGVVSRSFVQPDGINQDDGGPQAATRFPFRITTESMERGQQRYNIYCSPCHDFAGTGIGMVAVRGFRSLPQSFHTEQLRSAPDEYFFDVMTNGFGAMPTYANVISVQDRWAILAYIRALQLSQFAPVDALAPEDLDNLNTAQPR